MQPILLMCGMWSNGLLWPNACFVSWRHETDMHAHAHRNMSHRREATKECVVGESASIITKTGEENKWSEVIPFSLISLHVPIPPFHFIKQKQTHTHREMRAESCHNWLDDIRGPHSGPHRATIQQQCSEENGLVTCLAQPEEMQEGKKKETTRTVIYCSFN